MKHKNPYKYLKNIGYIKKSLSMKKTLKKYNLKSIFRSKEKKAKQLYIFMSFKARKIQSMFRMFKAKQQKDDLWVQSHGGKILVIDKTFAFEEIDNKYFYCLRDSGKYYGFDIRDLYKYVIIDKNIKNPYTNNSLSKKDINQMYRIMIKYDQRELIYIPDKDTVGSRIGSIYNKMLRLNTYPPLNILQKLCFERLYDVVYDLSRAYLLRIFFDYNDWCIIAGETGEITDELIFWILNRIENCITGMYNNHLQTRAILIASCLSHHNQIYNQEEIAINNIMNILGEDEETEIII